jgi:putative PIN family toxin of toxin-antitoxin system
MADKPRYVFDVNVIVSALLFEQSTPGQAVSAALNQGQLLLSAEIFAELTAVLARDKFDRYLTREEREQFLQALLQQSDLIEITESIQGCRDPKDDKYLSLAVFGNASCIVSGDQDLLVLETFRAIPILTPAQFVASFLGKE